MHCSRGHKVIYQLFPSKPDESGVMYMTGWSFCLCWCCPYDQTLKFWDFGSLYMQLLSPHLDLWTLISYFFCPLAFNNFKAPEVF